ncbi:invasion protein CiaB [Campylobacter sp. VicNov18]|uniref:invasion protein CiaB n=1 Tax=Campylobacter bilis TaxID=2691918 RepID=UPI00130EDF05|nr:invasion protein CiaB [Campylobacter bilis]MPV63907.1 invasion protein CiaB [Campylobacter hepaticus]MBM0637408.1 invasion protein CiaB [Campylobacter bilis]MCC8278129.1 invasion protein CiaB [Campylobacter bilis]MCC8299633.1 invasion protein CiaB [Campylobacter bilis]MCC8301038.1 invasion protein CiaB [Campylobacter bilis]
MNNFKQIITLINKRKEKNNAFYKILDKKKLDPYFKHLLALSELKEEKPNILAILKRLIDLKEENLVQQWQKNNFKEDKIAELKYKFYQEVRKFYEKDHQELINQIKQEKLLNNFYQSLIQGVHNIGLIINELEIAWSKQIIETNSKILATEFPSLDRAIEFLRKNHLYQKTPQGGICERSYGVLVKIANTWKLLPYATFFQNELPQLQSAFKNALKDLSTFASNEEERAYVRYFEKLQSAFCETNEDKIIQAWQDLEFAWMQIKSPLQVAHPLEYYEDNYTHAVALEWDIRLEDESNLDPLKLNHQIQKTFLHIYNDLKLKDPNLQKEVLSNIQKTQLYICTPMLFYGSELKGLFSAQVVPNDEFVSAQAGKKIFAFVNFVYENTKNRPFMKLASEIFDKEFLAYGREILFFQEQIWKRVYEVSTIGHEFGHILFIAKDTQILMDKSGFFKNIEEYKATAGGLLNFFYHEQEDLKMPVFHDLIKRAITLIAWQQVNEVRPYYTEALIHLSLLFQSQVLSFHNNTLKINFTLQAYESFKQAVLKNYYDLAKHYALKQDAKDFLNRFCELEQGIFFPRLKECKEFVQFYYELYKQIGNEIDNSTEFQRYQIQR